jgi:hypothetical protein
MSSKPLLTSGDVGEAAIVGTERLVAGAAARVRDA